MGGRARKPTATSGSFQVSQLHDFRDRSAAVRVGHLGVQCGPLPV